MASSTNLGPFARRMRRSATIRRSTFVVRAARRIDGRRPGPNRDKSQRRAHGHPAWMPTRNRPTSRAQATSRRLISSAIADIKTARVRAGLSQRDVGHAVDMSASQVGRFERGQLQDVTIEKVCRLSTAVGLEASLRLYPDGDPIRDAAQVRLLVRLHERIAAAVRWRTEVPLFGREDPRAWDAVADGTGCVDGFEAETRLSDIQATERRVMLKLRDDASIHHVFMVIADTRANRAALVLGRETLRGNFPLDTREVLASFANGRCPGANGLIII